MKRLEVKERMSKTIQDGYKTGRLKRRWGKNNPAWRGNRERSKVIRSRLYKPWIFKVLERDDFKCLMCKSKRNLEVHHDAESFKSIIDLITEDKSLNDLSYEMFEEVSAKIVAYHIAGVSGKTLCIDCHKKVDVRRN